MATTTPLFNAVSSSARQILMLLRCIAFAKKAHVRLSADGIRFSTEEGSVMEAFIFLDKALFSSYSFHLPASSTAEGEDQDPPAFEINLNSLLETFYIFSLADPTASKRSGEYDSYAAHRLNRHAGIGSSFNQPLGVTGVCTISYNGEGSPLSIHMSEAGVTTTCELTTYDAEVSEAIPFDREHLALKTIMRSNFLLEAVNELSFMSPAEISITASATARRSAQLSLTASGYLGSATVDFANDPPVETPILETFQCPARTTASFKFGLIKHAQRAMSSGTKVSLRLDEDGVLSLQFLVEVETNGSAADVAFVDFRIVPLVEGEAGGEDAAGAEGGYSSDGTDP
jgi:cell cycle checkpoint protein